MKKKGKEMTVFWLFLLPSLFVFINVVIIPFISGIVYSFTNWNGFSFEGSSFVGLANYTKVFSDDKFITAFGLSIKYTIAMIILVNIIGFALALIVTRKMKSANVLRSIYFLPNLIGGLILGFIWKFVFTKMFEQIAVAIGSENLKGWLDDPKKAFWALVIVGAWQMAGYVMVIYIAGIQNISDDMIEAAQIDGANPGRILRSIIMPLIAPSFTISLFVTLSGAFKQYDTNLSLTNGGPYGTTELITMNIFNTAFTANDYVYAQAKSIVFFLVIMLITVTQVYLTKKKEVEM